MEDIHKHIAKLDEEPYPLFNQSVQEILRAMAHVIRENEKRISALENKTIP